MKATKLCLFWSLWAMLSAVVFGSISFPQDHPPSDQEYSPIALAELKKMKPSELPRNVRTNGFILFFSWDFGDGYDGYIFSSRKDIESVDVNRGVKITIPKDLARRLKAEGLVKRLNKQRVTIYGKATIERLFASRQVVVLFDHLQENAGEPGQHDKSATR